MQLIEGRHSPIRLAEPSVVASRAREDVEWALERTLKESRGHLRLKETKVTAPEQSMPRPPNQVRLDGGHIKVTRRAPAWSAQKLPGSPSVAGFPPALTEPLASAIQPRIE